jgi:hypothetical protein
LQFPCTLKARTAGAASPVYNSTGDAAVVAGSGDDYTRSIFYFLSLFPNAIPIMLFFFNRAGRRVCTVGR